MLGYGHHVVCISNVQQSCKLSMMNTILDTKITSLTFSVTVTEEENLTSSEQIDLFMITRYGGN